MKVYFIGIGGIGTSALAQYYLSQNYKVSGSDLVSSEITNFLQKKGVKIFIGKHQSKNLPRDADFVIHSPAVNQNNPEIKEAIRMQARNGNLQILSYPEALGNLTKKYWTIAVTGTHGKSTTTAMIALLLIKAGLDPTVIIGTKLREFSNTNFRLGKSKYLVIEACEYAKSFLNYWPKMIILTNIEKEHLDYYQNLKNELQGFKEFISHLQKNGILIANNDDYNIRKILSLFALKAKPKIKFYSYSQKEGKDLKSILKVPGDHNVYNALAALSAARALKIPDKISFQALSQYQGSWRRFEQKKPKNKKIKAKIISDYAHHPTEIKATLKAAKEKYPTQNIICFFQPHQYQRTYYLFKDFVKVFKETLKKQWLKELFITDIYDVAGREKKTIKQEINSRKLVQAVHRAEAIYLPSQKLEKRFKEFLQKKVVIIVMGAGDIYKIAEKLK